MGPGYPHLPSSAALDGAKPLTTEPWVSVEEVATHLGVARDSVYRWIEVRRLPAHRIGRLWKFKLSEVDAWVREGDANDNGTRRVSAP
jgi:excisionase family DNA binding protein